MKSAVHTRIIVLIIIEINLQIVTLHCIATSNCSLNFNRASARKASHTISARSYFDPADMRPMTPTRGFIKHCFRFMFQGPYHLACDCGLLSVSNSIFPFSISPSGHTYHPTLSCLVQLLSYTHLSFRLGKLSDNRKKPTYDAAAKPSVYIYKHKRETKWEGRRKDNAFSAKASLMQKAHET